MDYLYRKPVVTSREITRHLGFSQTTSDRLLAELSRLGILRELTGRRCNRGFYFEDYFELFLKQWDCYDSRFLARFRCIEPKVTRASLKTMPLTKPRLTVYHVSEHLPNHVFGLYSPR